MGEMALCLFEVQRMYVRCEAVEVQPSCCLGKLLVSLKKMVV